MRKYIVLFDTSTKALAELVQERLEQGGQLVGGIALSGIGFAQAMTMPAKWRPK